MEAKIRAEGGVFMGKWERECQVLALGREKRRGLSVKWRREERGKGDLERKVGDSKDSGAKRKLRKIREKRGKSP